MIRRVHDADIVLVDTELEARIVLKALTAYFTSGPGRDLSYDMETLQKMIRIVPEDVYTPEGL